MKAFISMFFNGVKMLVRNTTLLVTSLGVALVSILIFGWLFGGSGNVKLALGVVNQDNTPASAQLIKSLQQNASLNVTVEQESTALDELQAGHRDAVIVLGSTFGSSLQSGQQAQIQVYFNQSNQTTLAITRQAVQSIVDGMNQNITHTPPPLSIQEKPVSVHNLGTIDFLLPGMLGMMLMWANLSVGSAIVDWRARGVLRRLAATPLRVGTLISSQMLSRLILSLLQAALLLGVGIWVFNVNMYGDWFMLALVVIMGTFTMQALGFGIATVAKNAEAAQSINLLISFPMMFLSGSYFSVSDAPNFLKPVINILPLTYINDALRQIVNNGAALSAIRTDLLVLAIWIVVGFILSTRTFRWSR